MGHETRASFMEFKMKADVLKHGKFLSINSVCVIKLMNQIS